MSEMKVKPLNWLPEKHGEHVQGWRSQNSILGYFVEDMGELFGQWRFWVQRSGYVMGKFSTESEAKSAAQADYEQSILSAIDLA